MKRVLALILGLILTFHLAGPANAAQPLKLRLLTTSAQIMLGSANQSFSNITVVVSGGKKATLSIQVIDLVLDKTGKSPVPAGSTRYSLAKNLKFEPKSFNYTASKSPQKFTFKVSSSAKNLKEVRYGGIQTVLATAATKSQVSSEIAAITTFAIVPKGLSLELGSSSIRSTEIANLQLVQKSKQSLADWLFPDIPGIVNQAPVVLQMKISNKNDLPVFSTQKVTWASNNNILATQLMPQKLLFAEQVIKISQNSTIARGDSDAQINFAKPFEKLKAKITFSTFLGGQVLKPVTKEIYVLVFPWKEILFWALILGLIIWQLLRSRQRLKSNFQPNIVWLFLVWVIKSLINRFKSSVSN